MTRRGAGDGALRRAEMTKMSGRLVAVGSKWRPSLESLEALKGAGNRWKAGFGEGG